MRVRIDCQPSRGEGAPRGADAAGAAPGGAGVAGGLRRGSLRARPVGLQKGRALVTFCGAGCGSSSLAPWARGVRPHSLALQPSMSKQKVERVGGIRQVNFGFEAGGQGAGHLQGRPSLWSGVRSVASGQT